MNKMAADFAATRVQAAPRSFAPARSRPANYARLRLYLYGILLLVDTLAIASAFLGADLIRFGFIAGYGATTFLVLFPIYVAVGVNGGAWSMDVLLSPRASAFAAIRSLLFSIGVATILFFSLKVGEDFSRLVFGIGSCLAVAMTGAARALVGQGLGERYGWTFRKDVLLLDGASPAAAGAELVVDAKRHGLRPDAHDPKMLDRLARALHGSERVIVACPADRRQAWSHILAGANVDVEILVPELGAIGALGLRRHRDTPTLLVACGPLRMRDRAIKRAFDLLLSGVSLALLAPMLLLVAVAIRLESPGPVLFKQARMGRGNRLFVVLKFRTMRWAAMDEDGARSVQRGDDRVTRVGRILRATSLDELPQLVNVLTGEMSIVGPRPHALGTRAEDQLLWTIDERYWNRHAIKPGLTGLAQVRGLRGETARRSDLTARLQSDLEYLEGWHIGRDIAIVLRTLGVLVHPNAF